MVKWLNSHTDLKPRSGDLGAKRHLTIYGASAIPLTHYHLHLLHVYTAIFHDGEGAVATGSRSTTYIFYTSTRPFSTTARVHPSCDRLRGSLRSGDMSPREAGRDKRDPPAVRPKTYQLPSTNYPLHKYNRKSQIVNNLPTTN